MIRLLLLVVCAAPALAQTAVLGGWALPEGAVVESEMSIETEGTLAAPGFSATYRDGGVKVTTTEIEEVDRAGALRLMRALQRLVSSEGKRWVDGVRSPVEPDPLLGRDVAVVRTEAGWAQVAAGWAPSPRAAEALAESISLDDAEYPLRPVAVGETVEVDAEAIRAVYVDVAPGAHRLTVTLDSLGTRDGAPVAYLSQRVGITLVADDEGGTMRMDMTARIVRRLDWMIDVETTWEGPVSYDLGEMTLRGTMRYDGVQTVTMPEDR